jgi:hypothetical protein
MSVDPAGRLAFGSRTYKKACLAWKYETAAERGFFRALKELRQVEKEHRAATTSPGVGASKASLGSFLPAESLKSILKTLPASPPEPTASTGPKPVSTLVSTTRNPFAEGSLEIPIMVDRAV